MSDDANNATAATDAASDEGKPAGALAQRTKAMLEGGRERAQELWSDFRRNSLYFQVKAGLVAAYVVVVLATLVLAPPSPPSFRLVEGHVPWGVGKRTYLDLDNLDLGTLKGVVVEVHGQVVSFDGSVATGPWRMTVPRLEQGDTVRVWPEKLMTQDHQPAGDNLDVSRVRVYQADDPSDVILDAAPDAASE